MRIRELVAELAKHNPDAKVVIWHDAVVVGIEEVHFSDPKNGGDGLVYLMPEITEPN